MLDVEAHFVIKDLYRKGVSISEIARQTGHDRKTVRKLAHAPLAAARRRAAPPRTRKLDPFIPLLERRMQDGVTNALKLYGELDAAGYDGGYTQVKVWVRARRPPRTPVATTRFETAPGDQAQVDFAHFGTIPHQGRDQRVYAFLMTLGWSRMLFVTFSLTCDWVAFLRGHQAAFTAFGGVPRTVLHDNLKSAVISRTGGAVRFHPRYLDFADYYGFTPKACRPYRAQTKGKVERAVQYLRGNFWQGRPPTGLEDLNAHVTTWLATVANCRVHATTGVTPQSRLPHEGLTAVHAQPPYAITPVVARQATRDGWVHYAGSTYAVPLRAAGQPVLVHLGAADDLTLTTASGSVLAHYPLATLRGSAVGRATADMPTPPPSASPSLAPVVEQRALSAYDVLLEDR